MSRQIAAAVIVVTCLIGLGTTGCTDNVCHGQAICGSHNGGNGIGSGPSASGNSRVPPERSTPTDSATPSIETPIASPSPGSIAQGGSSDGDRPASASPTRSSRPQSVSLYTLCQSADDVFTCGAYRPRTVSVGDRIFDYVGETNPNDHSPDWKIVMGMSSTTCSTITLRFAAGAKQSSADQVVRLQLTQQYADAVEATAKAGTIGKLTAKIVGGSSFKVKGSASDDTSVVVNGSASCTTVSGH
ncbi:hypothetical protein [Streptomyces sp. MUM 16J]|uniref:hypothetical protein n=1 Tax=Streptomyces sp. MUM 16J TaxID=2791988 RepID=UPI001F03CFAB|nr:hypothetical protein [Streptomyces sp. MUM 16J]MCH0560973.1 hypothetical protein [Streptomyces sp. MUM 16J]